MDRGAWQATVHGIAESDMTANNTFTFTKINRDDLGSSKRIGGL